MRYDGGTMTKRLIVRAILGGIGAYLATIVVPEVTADHQLLTFALMGVFIALGDLVAGIVQAAAGFVLFFIPSSVRTFVLRMVVVGIAAALTTGFSLGAPAVSLGISLAGTALLVSLLFLLPFAS